MLLSFEREGKTCGLTSIPSLVLSHRSTGDLYRFSLSFSPSSPSPNCKVEFSHLPSPFRHLPSSIRSLRFVSPRSTTASSRPSKLTPASSFLLMLGLDYLTWNLHQARRRSCVPPTNRRLPRWVRDRPRPFLSLSLLTSFRRFERSPLSLFRISISYYILSDSTTTSRLVFLLFLVNEHHVLRPPRHHRRHPSRRAHPGLRKSWCWEDSLSLGAFGRRRSG